MKYTGGFPDFSIEKPMPMVWPSAKVALEERQASGRYEAELKLNEHRGFLTIDENGEPTFYTYRYSTPIKLTGPVMEHVKRLNLPPCSVFDGGHFYRLAFSKNSYLWIFDVLVLNGERVTLGWEQRRELRDQLFKPDKYIWVPLRTDTFATEFEAMLSGTSLLIKQAALQYGVPYNLLVKEIEGLVIKRKDSKLRFPRTKIESPSYIKVRIADVNKGRK